MRRKLKNKNTRKLFARGGSTAITLPKEILSELKWRNGQKVNIRRSGTKIIIADWE